MMLKHLSLFPLVAALSISACAEDKTKMSVETSAPEQPTERVEKTEEEWKKILTPEQFRILRKDGTDAPNSKVYKQFKEQGEGTYYCAGCNAELFTSKTKFDSRCGWPSFYDPSKAKNVKMSTDYKLGYARTEVSCAVCDGHLGHVFEGEGFSTPTDQRYCINGTALKFVPGPVDAATAQTDKKEKTATETKEPVEEKK